MATTPKKASEAQIKAAKQSLHDTGSLPDGISFHPGQDPEFTVTIETDDVNNLIAVNTVNPEVEKP